MESRFIAYQNKKIHYRVTGSGKPVVLLHGFGEDGNIWNELVKELQNDFYVIVPDIPGSGQSEMLDRENILPAGKQVSIEDYAEVIKGIVDKEISAECAVIGHSMGGYITLAFATKYPEMLNRFGLLNSTAFADDDAKKQNRLKAIDFIKDNGAYAFLRTTIPNLFASKQHQTKIEELIEEGRNFTPEALIQYYQAMMNRPDTTDILKEFNKPVLFIIGEKDNAIPLQASLQQCYLPSISHVHILEAGHMGMIEDPETCKHVLQSFLNN
jgi:pimeloyl-ACP methyl ester carboxylesterase